MADIARATIEISAATEEELNEFLKALSDTIIDWQEDDDFSTISTARNVWKENR